MYFTKSFNEQELCSGLHWIYSFKKNTREAMMEAKPEALERRNKNISANDKLKPFPKLNKLSKHIKNDPLRFPLPFKAVLNDIENAFRKKISVKMSCIVHKKGEQQLNMKFSLCQNYECMDCIHNFFSITPYYP
ncbi:CLUMA_CG003058, isoform A [Clunio marinus]|uniref:CLUMA_CG003058, isoform A n=1 Tax=Clunio marinus TaxID=568069 RepID=A0A1J1HMX0_9DIPT|nr:CLUMA_CG003058, isoform A [Clunio marinus]